MGCKGWRQVWQPPDEGLRWCRLLARSSQDRPPRWHPRTWLGHPEAAGVPASWSGPAGQGQRGARLRGEAALLCPPPGGRVPGSAPSLSGSPRARAPRSARLPRPGPLPGAASRGAAADPAAGGGPRAGGRDGAGAGGPGTRSAAPASPQKRRSRGAWTRRRGSGTMTPPHFAVALILGALPGVVSFDSVLGYSLPPRHHHAPSRGPQDPYSLTTQRRPQKTRPPPPLPRSLRAPRAHGLRTPRPPPGDCPAGAPGANVTDSGAPCLRWADAPPFLARSPPEGWAQLRGQRHNFCRSPDGAGRPWCFYANARGKVDWGYCDCRRGEWPRGGGDRGPAGSPPGWASALGAPGGERGGGVAGLPPSV